MIRPESKGETEAQHRDVTCLRWHRQEETGSKLPRLVLNEMPAPVRCLVTELQRRSHQTASLMASDSYVAVWDRAMPSRLGGQGRKPDRLTALAIDLLGPDLPSYGRCLGSPLTPSFLGYHIGSPTLPAGTGHLYS
jgi:hypothetical protein